MMKQKDLRSLKQNPELSRQMENMDPASIEQVQRVVEQYQDKSEGELYEELRKKAGNVSQQRMNAMAEKLVPLLDPTQQERLRAIITDLKRR